MNDVLASKQPKEVVVLGRGSRCYSPCLVEWTLLGTAARGQL